MAEIKPISPVPPLPQAPGQGDLYGLSTWASTLMRQLFTYLSEIARHINFLQDQSEISGTWTPIFKGTTTDPTATLISGANVGNYVRRGRVVTLTFGFNLATYSGGSGTLGIGGLPFSVATDNGVNANGGAHFTYFSVNGTLPASFGAILGGIVSHSVFGLTDFIRVIYSNTTGNSADLPVSAIAASAWIIGTATYLTDDE